MLGLLLHAANTGIASAKTWEWRRNTPRRCPANCSLRMDDSQGEAGFIVARRDSGRKPDA
jgi:hypothetical protein